MKKLLAVIIALIVLAVVIIGGIAFLGDNDSSSSSSIKVVETVEEIGEIATLQLSIVDVLDEQKATPFLGLVDLPGSTRKTLIKIEYDAKLGIDGTEVTITPKGKDAYEIRIPSFIFIGYDNLGEQFAIEQNGILSWTNPAIDKDELARKIFTAEHKQVLLKKYEEPLKTSTELFFIQLIKAIDPSAKVSFVY